jgi:hypothetical protein
MPSSVAQTTSDSGVTAAHFGQYLREEQWGQVGRSVGRMPPQLRPGHEVTMLTEHHKE